MPTIMTHAVVPLALGIGLGNGRVPRRLVLAGMGTAMLPDADVVSFMFGVARGTEFAHRGMSHSLVFALLVGLVGAACCRQLRAGALASFLFLSVSTASHGLLDSFTNGGSGIALLWPFTDERFFAPWRPVEVSPIGARFFSARGVDVLASEFMWVWMPCLGLAVLALLGRRAASRARNAVT